MTFKHALLVGAALALACVPVLGDQKIQWKQLPATPLIPANNLSELASPSISRNNLGLGALSTVTPGSGVSAALGNPINAANGVPTIGGTGVLAASSFSGAFAPTQISYPLLHGVKCDNSTDDAAALNAWFATIPANSVIEFPAGGVCKFSAQIVLPAVDGLIWKFNGATLLYTGASTATSLISAGTANVALGCSVRRWQMYNLVVQSSTTMTGGDALLLNEICDSGLHTVKMDGNQNGNGKLWGGLHLNGCNTVRIDGESEFRAQTAALSINGDSTYQCTDPFLTGAIIVGSKIGLHLCGAVGGFVGTNTDILENGDNVVIDQLCVSRPNLQIFFGSGFAIDVTNGTGNSHGIDVLDAGSSNSFLSLTGTWVVSSVSDNIKLGVAGQTWNVNVTGGHLGNTTGSGLYQNSVNVHTNVVGTEVWGAGHGLNNGAGTLNKCGVMFYPVNTSDTLGTVGSSC